jgi:hypothetical protein
MIGEDLNDLVIDLPCMAKAKTNANLDIRFVSETQRAI